MNKPNSNRKRPDTSKNGKMRKQVSPEQDKKRQERMQQIISRFKSEAKEK
ncbi:hypothetical protein [Ammoniphilus resinae]|uniref:tRNA A37 methylthiotransferase MiaB n=1 Tax=Ammoniphilus resinae TaxID=861532 RepID=A0ABS4GMX1_9BACL|nr:hypothetical protein [Ammoniphilus resinae]MBP1931609.1 tRNA A37 methylthiotransferase MiaB [Ammoniphilus resinae]